jgi:hypothetical protein
VDPESLPLRSRTTSHPSAMGARRGGGAVPGRLPTSGHDKTRGPSKRTYHAHRGIKHSATTWQEDERARETKHAQWAIRSGAGGALEIDKGPALTLSLRLASSTTSTSSTFLAGVDLEPDGMLPLDPHARPPGDDHTQPNNPADRRPGEATARSRRPVADGAAAQWSRSGQDDRLEGGLAMFNSHARYSH